MPSFCEKKFIAVIVMINYVYVILKFSFILALSADTVPPTASVTASRSFTNASNVSVNISFSKPCNGGGGFGCSSVNTCNVSRCQLKIILLFNMFQHVLLSYDYDQL